MGVETDTEEPLKVSLGSWRGKKRKLGSPVLPGESCCLPHRGLWRRELASVIGAGPQKLVLQLAKPHRAGGALRLSGAQRAQRDGWHIGITGEEKKGSATQCLSFKVLLKPRSPGRLFGL